MLEILSDMRLDGLRPPARVFHQAILTINKLKPPPRASNEINYKTARANQHVHENVVDALHILREMRRNGHDIEVTHS